MRQSSIRQQNTLLCTRDYVPIMFGSEGLFQKQLIFRHSAHPSL